MRRQFLLWLTAIIPLALIACEQAGTEALGICFGPDSPENAPCRWEPTGSPLTMKVEGAAASNHVFVVYENDEAGRFGTPPVATVDGRYGGSEVLTIVEADDDGEARWEAKISALGLSYIYRSYLAISIWGEMPVP